MATEYGRWRVVKSVGEGGQAHLFLVLDAKGEHPGQYVLKRLKNPGRMDLFQREVEAIRRLNHPNILRVVDFDLDHDPPYYVAEYCEGGSLAKDRRRAVQGIGDIKPLLGSLPRQSGSMSAATTPPPADHDPLASLRGAGFSAEETHCLGEANPRRLFRLP